jgi:hypothetical protein
MKHYSFVSLGKFGTDLMIVSFGRAETLCAGQLIGKLGGLMDQYG